MRYMYLGYFSPLFLEVPTSLGLILKNITINVIQSLQMFYYLMVLSSVFRDEIEPVNLLEELGLIAVENAAGEPNAEGESRVMLSILSAPMFG